MDIDTANLLLNIVTLAMGLIGGFICWKWIKPADAKMAKLQSELERRNDEVKDLRNILLTSVVRNKEAIYDHIVSASSSLYKAFQSLYAKSAFLGMLRAMNDLGIIWQKLSENERGKFGDFLRAIVPGDVLTRKPTPEDLGEVELFASVRAWDLYSLAELLFASAQIQIISFGVFQEEVKFDKDKLYKQSENLFPEGGHILREFGTMGYWSLMERIRVEIIKELRQSIGASPVTIELLTSNSASIDGLFSNLPPEFRSVVLPKNSDKSIC